MPPPDFDFDPFELEQNQIAEPLDEATKAALDEGLASAQRGELYTLDEVREHLKQRIEARRAAKAQQQSE